MILRYTIDEFPSLVYFEQEIPSVFDGDLENGREVLAWVVDLLTGADIEEVRHIHQSHQTLNVVFTSV
jgi:hypothetical protein